MPNVTIDQAVDAYIKLRNKKAEIEASIKDQVDTIKKQMDKLEAFMIQQASAQGVKSFKTEHGTAFLTTKDFATVADWDTVLEFIKQNDAYDLLERRVSKAAVRSHIDLHKQPPAGVTYGSHLGVNVRKPSN